MKVFISTSQFASENSEPLQLLKSRGIEPELNPYRRKLSEDEIIELLKQIKCEGLIAGLEPLTKRVFQEAKELKVISRLGVGLENVDIGAANHFGIKVFNTPGLLTDAVAELTLALILNCLRHISFLDRNLRKGIWEKGMGSLLKGKCVGIVGFGHIGQRVAELVTAFDAKVIYFDIEPRTTSSFNAVTLDVLLKQADIISMHASGSRQILGKSELALLKKGAVIINTARAAVIDEQGLIDQLSTGRIAGAGIDVFSEEPYSGELLNLKNVVLTPHIGSYAIETRAAMEAMAVNNLIQGFKELQLI